jgi:hypothetical protein
VERVFWRFLRRVLGLRAGTPTAVLLAEAGQYPLSVDILVGLARAWNRYVSMPEERLARQVFDHNLTLMGANIAPNKLRAPWSTQMVHCLSDASPLAPDGSPQLIDVQKLRVKLQDDFLDSLRSSEKSMTVAYLDIVGSVTRDTFGPAAHLQAVRSAYSRQSLTQLRTGSHWLAVATAIWAAGPTPPRHQRLCSRCRRSEVDDVGHMLWSCPALEAERMQHSSLFMTPAASLAEFFQQDSPAVASFARACRQTCQRLREG